MKSCILMVLIVAESNVKEEQETTETSLCGFGGVTMLVASPL
jgi:hypothetical protein